LSVIESALDAMFLGNSAQGKLQTSYYEQMAPFRMQIECSTECSADCNYCYAKVTEPGEPLTTRELKGLLRRAANLGVKHVDWMGGDPLERPDWIELLQAARYCGMTNNLWTCGPRLNDVVTSKRVIELTEGGYVMVHLDSLDPDVLQRMRRSYTPLTTRETLKGIELLQDMGKPAYEIGNLVMLTSVQSNEDVRRTMETLYTEHGIRTCLMSLKPVDEAGRLTALVPTAEAVDAAYRSRDELFMTGHNMGCQDFPKEYCGTTLFVSVDGHVSSCYSLRRKLGSVRESTLEDIVARNTSFLFFTEYRKEERNVTCPTCETALCWGCRANAFYFGNGAYSQDPLCAMGGQRSKVDLPY
jgi:MoaA/NifB/PqqE/SkfB family radical SAM enzyme